MGATLDALHRLQAIEHRLQAVRQRLGTKKRELKVQGRRLAELQDNNQRQHERMMQLQAEIDRLELDRKSREEEIAKYREQMKATRTNKEYAAIRVQINTLDANNRKLEDRILDLMSQSDAMKKEGASIQTDRDKQAARVEKLNQDFADLERETNPQIAELMAEREESTSRVPAGALEAFERVCKHHDSEAMAPAVQPHAKREEYICGGCQMGIPLQKVNAIMGTDDIQTCDVCGRILYLDATGAKGKAAAS
jgi:uncharacterized protein